MFGTTREWLKLDSSGGGKLVQVDRHKVIAEGGVRYRDLRLLDPTVPTPSPSCIFIREKALVLNLEAIRMIVFKDKVYVLSVPETGKSLARTGILSVSNSFVQDLLQQLCPPEGATGPKPGFVDRQLPFELRAVEAALATTTRAFQSETDALERLAGPTLKALLDKVSHPGIGTLRECKSQLVKLSARVLQIKKALEAILDEDKEMAAMYLARSEEYRTTLAQQKAEQEELLRQESLLEGTGQHDNIPAEPEATARRDTMESLPGEGEEGPRRDGSHVAWGEDSSSTLLTPGEQSSAQEGDTAERQGSQGAAVAEAGLSRDQGSLDGSRLHRRGSQTVRMWDRLSRGVPQSKLQTLVQAMTLSLQTAEVEEANNISHCEDLLEAYWSQIDFLNNRLTSLAEQIQNSEEELNMSLDRRRNELAAANLFLTFFAALFGVITALSGIFGMNLDSGVPDEDRQMAFNWVCISSVIFGVVSVLLFVSYSRLNWLY